MVGLSEYGQIIRKPLSVISVFARAISDIERDRVDYGTDFEILPQQRGQMSCKGLDIDFCS